MFSMTRHPSLFSIIIPPGADMVAMRSQLHAKLVSMYDFMTTPVEGRRLIYTMQYVMRLPSPVTIGPNGRIIFCGWITVNGVPVPVAQDVSPPARIASALRVELDYSFVRVTLIDGLYYAVTFM